MDTAVPAAVVACRLSSCTIQIPLLSLCFASLPENLRRFPEKRGGGACDFFLIVFQGATGHVGGTSASSPTFAGVIVLLNDAHINAELPPLGFLNPLLYSTGVAGLNDITVRNNARCGTEGFNASTGWDPVTGLGTPNFGKLKDIVLGA
ncbi:hypothetical protein EW146_g8886 [Bondarzewia mesenterica]|uniref:Peptidase S53 domain-containing protein n=1 Tax=Bondarzewia mesenterica TaxID=1095465 RepID=A0A4S4LAP6_9AGAM|nr:hypothetical protein EW146_g8886 [Bondarzewia mesenterica]